MNGFLYMVTAAPGEASLVTAKIIPVWKNLNVDRKQNKNKNKNKGVLCFRSCCGCRSADVQLSNRGGQPRPFE